MATQEQLGLFWGKNALYFVESFDGGIKNIFSVPIAKEESIIGNIAGAELKNLVTPIQNALSHQQVNKSIVNLCLPIKDIIFRTFVIPWMNASEIKGVVDFEASKYIPFALEQLSFSYYPMTITEDGKKRIRIIFVAVKKDVYNMYTGILERAGLQANVVEPAPLSLIRALAIKDTALVKKTFALIVKGDDDGKILIIDQGVPQFVREFHLRVPAAEQTSDPNALMTRLINETRISLDYFSRQNSELTINQLILLTNMESDELAKSVQSEMEMEVAHISSFNIVKDNEHNDIDYLNAYGSAIEGIAKSAITLDLASDKPKSASAPEIQTSQNINLKTSIITAAVCGVIFLLTFIFSNGMVNDPSKKHAQLKKQLAPYGNRMTETIKTENAKMNKRINGLQGIRVKSDVAYFLATIPDLLPEGTWIESMNVNYVASEAQPGESPGELPTFVPEIKISGYAYVKSRNAQFRQVNKLLRNLKGREDFNNFFDDIKLETTNSKRLGDFEATFYEIILM